MRSDLRPGLQMAQAIHAAVEHALRFPEQMKRTPNTIVLAVADERELLEWADRLAGWCGPDAHIEGTPWTLFHEPDLEGHPDGWHTALACFSDGAPFASLPLAGKVPVMSG